MTYEEIVSMIEEINYQNILTYDDKYINNDKSMLGQKRELPAIISNKLKEKTTEETINKIWLLMEKYSICVRKTSFEER